jgi:hypothetical protein
MSEIAAADRPLLRALVFTFFIHAAAMVSMALLLMKGLPGGSGASGAARTAYVAGHPWLWRLGWLPWGLTALSDLILSVALVRTRWVPKIPAIIAMVLACAAVVPDQAGQIHWMTRGVAMAQAAVSSGDYSAYLAYETRIFGQIAFLASALYLAGALAWTWAFASAGLWNRALTWTATMAWTLFLFACIAPVLPVRPAAWMVAAANGAAFVLLQLFFWMLIELLLRRSRVIQGHGRNALWHHPRGGILGGALTLAANSQSIRAFCECLPVPAFVSDVTDVIYVNYLLPAQRLEGLVPDGLELDRLGPNRDLALLTFLTYRHGHFGPRMLGPLRKLLPSPVQSNWRIYVREKGGRSAGIYFFTNAISSTLHALSARLLSEGMPMHVLERAKVERGEDGKIHLRFEGGKGSAPDCEATLAPTEDRTLPASWKEGFADYDAFLAYCVPQDRALSSQPWHGRITRQEINLGIPLSNCQPLAGQVHSRAAEAIAGDAPAVCFHVPRVNFLFTGEEHDRMVP